MMDKPKRGEYYQPRWGEGIVIQWMKMSGGDRLILWFGTMGYGVLIAILVVLTAWLIHIATVPRPTDYEQWQSFVTQCELDGHTDCEYHATQIILHGGK